MFQAIEWNMKQKNFFEIKKMIEINDFFDVSDFNSFSFPFFASVFGDYINRCWFIDFNFEQQTFI